MDISIKSGQAGRRQFTGFVVMEEGFSCIETAGRDRGVMVFKLEVIWLELGGDADDE